MRLAPSLHSLSVYCCREVVAGWAVLSFTLLSSSCLGLEQLELLWGWNCCGAGITMRLELLWGWSCCGAGISAMGLILLPLQ